jgi:hypothetical protein
MGCGCKKNNQTTQTQPQQVSAVAQPTNTTQSSPVTVTVEEVKNS